SAMYGTDPSSVFDSVNNYLTYRRHRRPWGIILKCPSATRARALLITSYGMFRDSEASHRSCGKEPLHPMLYQVLAFDQPGPVVFLRSTEPTTRMQRGISLAIYSSMMRLSLHPTTLRKRSRVRANVDLEFSA